MKQMRKFRNAVIDRHITFFFQVYLCTDMATAQPSPQNEFLSPPSSDDQKHICQISFDTNLKQNLCYK